MRQTRITSTPAYVTTYHRQYERYIVFYTLIMLMILGSAYFVFGWHITGLNATQNLLADFVALIVFAAMIVLTPLWYQWFFEWLPETNNRQERINKRIDEIADDDQRALMLENACLNGEMPPTQLQTNALIVMFVILLCELFLIQAWVQGSDRHLVWQPEWVNSINRWVEYDSCIGLCIADIEMDEDFLAKYFKTLEEYKQSAFYPSLTLFSAWRFFSVPIQFVCFCIVNWRMVDWLCMERVNPKNISGIGSFLWVSFLSVFVLSFTVAPLAEMMMPDLVGESVMKPHLWFWDVIRYFLMMTFGLWAVKFWHGWFLFYKRLFNLYFRGIHFD